MKAFLEQLADEIIKQSGDNPGNTCVVLPNRRAGLFLKKFLADRYKKTFFPPEIYSIEDFFVKYSGYHPSDQMELTFELYRVYLELNPEAPQDFDSFSPWGQVLLSDFNELDLYLADPQKIFRDISDTRALTVWNLGERPLTPFEKNYIAFYRSLLDYYLKFRERLLASGNVYPGLAHRLLAENIEEASRSFTWDRIFFAGLNALSKSEEVVIRHLVEKNMAQIFWDADRYYLDDPYQEAGSFIREYLKEFRQDPARWIVSGFKEEKEITITGVPGHTGQATYAGHLLKEILAGKERELHKTAVVLADEQLLLPMLNALPGEIESFNITMGYPLKLTPVFHFFQLLFKLHTGSERIRQRYQEEEARFYVHDVINVLAAPYLKMSGRDTTARINGYISGLRSSGRVIYSAISILKRLDHLPAAAQKICQHIFTRWSGPEQALDRVQAILDALKNILADSGADILEMEYIYHFARLIRRVRQSIEKHTFIGSLKSLEKIIFQLFGSQSLPFYGEPLSGLQMMGVLETRAIDFEQLVILSVNEGVLPRGKMSPSFIPFDIKKDYDLPTHREKDAIFAYHFYRLLQRARKIHLLYETEGTRLGGGERSRFITQLLYELPRYNEDIEPLEKVMSLPPTSALAKEDIRIEKSSTVREKLIEKAARGYSPSALNTFIQCSLKFYFQEIAELSEPEEVEETIEARTMGNVIHHALHQLYKTTEGQVLSPEELKKLKKGSEKALLSAFREIYPEGDLEQGKNLLIVKVAQKMVQQFLSQQENQLRRLAEEGLMLKVLHLERFFDTERPVDLEGGTLIVKLKGKADRIDSVGGVTRVIDYKTGSVYQPDLKIKDWDLLTTEPRYGKAFQLMMYAYLLYKSQGDNALPLETGNISLREPSKGFIQPLLPHEQVLDSEAFSAFETQLTTLLESIYDPTTTFSRTDDRDQCQYCAFKGICGR